MPGPSYLMTITVDVDFVQVKRLRNLVRDVRSFENAPQVFRVSASSVALHGRADQFQSIQFRLVQERALPGELHGSWRDLVRQIRDSQDRGLEDLNVAADFMLLCSVLKLVDSGWGIDAAIDAVARNHDRGARRKRARQLLTKLKSTISADIHAPGCGGSPAKAKPLGLLPELPAALIPPLRLAPEELLAYQAQREQVSPASLQLDL